MSFDRAKQAQQPMPSDNPPSHQQKANWPLDYSPTRPAPAAGDDWEGYPRQSPSTIYPAGTMPVGQSSFQPSPYAPALPPSREHLPMMPIPTSASGTSAPHDNDLYSSTSGSSSEWPRQYSDRMNSPHYMPSRELPQPSRAYTQQRTNSPPFDPVRSSAASDKIPVRQDPYVPHKSASNIDRNSDILVPAMSISQLLSSEPSNGPSLAASSHSKGSVENSSSSRHTGEQHTTPQVSASSARRGIQSLLNSDTEESARSANSDTDTEDISLVRPHTHEGGVTNGAIKIQKQGDNEEAMLASNYNLEDMSLTSPQELPDPVTNTHDIYDFSDDSLDDFSDRDDQTDNGKTLTESMLEELQLSDDDYDDLIQSYQREMVDYMLRVHKRKKRAIEAYERRRASRNSKLKDHLELLYEQRYGNPMPKHIMDSSSSLSASLMYKAEKNRRKRKHKRIMGRRGAEDVEFGSDGSDVSDHEAFLDPDQVKRISRRRLDEERRNIWLHIARKDIPRMSRILSRVQATRAGNCKKIAQYCQKESKRAATKGGRISKDVQTKAKRAMKEMLLFWKKNEKEERELRKKAEKEALDRQKMEEERREAQRQARKLNFLITQTELYSHFIGRKIKDAGDDDETAVPQSDTSTPTPVPPGATMDLDTSAGEQPIGEVDFDEDDEEILREKARLSAQNALAKQREQTRVFDEGARKRRLAAGDNPPDMNVSQAAFDMMNFQEPSTLGSGPEVKQPSLLMCQLKNYQLKGLNWLANLYEQGINGILADEMGLGKTVQSISLMAYLAEVHNIWGPFLVIAPSSTLHNWQQEISRFVPSLKALPYWGNPKDRKVLRQFWSRKQLYGRDAPFHVVITSYQLIVTDVSYFQRVKWQYMVLDEAQAIKSSSSTRWKQLLGFHCRNRLLLTGTPIQNSMQELWALLHFIMPTLFDSHQEFSEWFSKDIESHAENRGSSLNEHQLRRLQMILKPFMLRRVKRNVQHELGEKIEIEMYCDLTARQRAFYRGLKEKLSVSELLETATSLNDSESMDSLMNLVMQFRKVCNHPELFERADVRAPFAFCNFGMTTALAKETHLYCPYTAHSPITFRIPKRLYRNGGILRVPGLQSRAGFNAKYLENILSIWSADYIQASMFSSEADAAFSFLRFADITAGEASDLFKASLITRWLAYLAHRELRARRRFYLGDNSYTEAPVNTFALFQVADTMTSTCPLTITNGTALDELTHIADKMIHLTSIFDEFYIPGARAVPIDMVCSDVGFEREQRDTLFDPNVRACLFGRPAHLRLRERETAADLSVVVRRSDGEGLMTVPSTGQGYSLMKVPAMRDLILDAGKLAMLDKLLAKLKAEGHRCLIYFQMTRMIDLMEEYITYKQYRYLRLDGSSKISDRRDMVQDWQTRPEIFLFLLSTRAGGLGINLTAADTVIFYDSDWNPTNDLQAMDRAHRLGQTKQVTVYRLITKGTIEERILQRAKQKDEIQKMVISGGEFKPMDLDRKEIVSLLLDDEELESKLKQKEQEQQLQKESSSPSSASSPAPSVSSQQRPAKRPRKGPSSQNGAAGNTKIGRPRTNISFTG